MTIRHNNNNDGKTKENNCRLPEKQTFFYAVDLFNNLVNTI